MIFDSGMIRRDVPAFNVATRGIAYFHVTVRTGDRDLHSGMYGGAALNAAHALIQALDGADRPRRDAGRAAAPGNRRSDRARSSRAGRELPSGADELAEAGARPKDDRAPPSDFYLRTFAEPALDVNGIASGSPHLQKTVLPVEAIGERLDQARSGSAGRGDRAGASSGCCAPPRPPAPTLDVEHLVVRARPGWSRRTRRRSSSGSTRSSGRSAGGPR